MVVFKELEQYHQKNLLQFVQKYKRSRIAKAILIKQNRAGGIMLPDFNLMLQN